MNKYDPSKAPTPTEWNALSHDAQLTIIKKYHDMIGIPVPNLEKHATLHLIIETQIAMGDEIPLSKEVDRLLSEGADRHSAIHGSRPVVCLSIGCAIVVTEASLRAARVPVHTPVEPVSLRCRILYAGNVGDSSLVFTP